MAKSEYKIASQINLVQDNFKKQTKMYLDSCLKNKYHLGLLRRMYGTSKATLDFILVTLKILLENFSKI